MILFCVGLALVVNILEYLNHGWDAVVGYYTLDRLHGILAAVFAMTVTVTFLPFLLALLIRWWEDREK